MTPNASTPVHPPASLEHTLPPGDVQVHLQAAPAPLVGAAEKEALIAQGVSYGMLLTEEGVPSAVQQAAYVGALGRNGERVGELIAALTASVLREFPAPVLVSLARAGTPVGCAMRRLARRWGHDLPHHTLSIIRGVGIDLAALAAVQLAHPHGTLIFVDGWTGKGSIQGTLAASLPAGMPAHLAVLSDPAGVATLAATHDDLLLPHAALNATVCGLISRTFLTSTGLASPGQLHGARIEEHLRPHDQTMAYLEALDGLTATFGPDFPLAPSPRPARPFDEVLALAAGLGVSDAHRVKPSVGEATRVFLRRAPAHLMLRSADHPDTRHLVELAAASGTPVSVHPRLPYLAAALIGSGAPA